MLGHDNDIGYGVLRMAREQKWHPANLGQPVYNALLATLFQWGVALHDLDLEAIRKGEKDPKVMKRQLAQIGRKVRRQIAKDYVVYPALTGPSWMTTLTANATANLMRNLWSYMIIFCGHFPDGALHFTEEELEDETRAEWYLRQMLGSANFEGGPLLHIMSRQPRLPDRAPPVPRPAEQPLRRDRGQGAGAVREVRHPLHDRAAVQAVRPGAAHDHEAVAAQRDDQRDDRRRARRSRRAGRSTARRKLRRRAPDRAGASRRLVAGLGSGATTDRRRSATFADLPLDAGARAPGRRSRAAPYDRTGTRGRASLHLDKARVTQCALSRICGVCGDGLGRPSPSSAPPQEDGRNAFHFPPLHRECAEPLGPRTLARPRPVLGPGPDAGERVVVTTLGLRVRPPRPGRTPTGGPSSQPRTRCVA